MKRFIIALLLLCTIPAHAANFDFGFNWHTAPYSSLVLNAPLTSTLPSGSTFTRASKQYVTDFEGQLRPVYDGYAAIEGSRVVTNLIGHSENFANLGWAFYAGASYTGGETAPDGSATAIKITSSANGGYVFRADNTPAGTLITSVWLRGNGTILLKPNTATGASLTIELTSTWARYAITAGTTGSSRAFQIQGIDITDTVYMWHPQTEFVASQTNTNPSEYVPTTSAPVTQCFDYQNPNTVDANGVVTDTGTRTPIANIKGILLEPATTNKITGYSIIPGDTYGSTLSSGTATKGKVYEIVTHTSVDWEAVGTRLSGTANTVGAKYVISGTLTFTANDTGKEVIMAVGTKASALNTTAIAGLTFSGYNQTTGNLVVGASYKIVARTTLDFTTCGAANNTVGTVFTATSAGTLGAGDSVDNLSVNCSIVDDTAALQAIGVYGVTGVKAYKLDNSFGAGTLTAKFSGSTGNVNPHSAFSNVRTTVAGAGLRLEDSSGANWTSFTESATYVKLSGENKTPQGTATQLTLRVQTSGIAFLVLPQLEELPYSTSVTPSQGATATRAATVESQPTTSIPSNGPWSMSFEWTPAVTGSSTRYLWGSYTDANNAMQILYNGTTVTFRKRVGGTNHDATKTLSASAGTTYRISVRVNADKTTDLFIDGVKGTGSADTTAPVLSTTMQLGSDGNGANQIVGQIRNLKIWRSARPDSAL